MEFNTGEEGGFSASETGKEARASVAAVRCVVAPTQPAVFVHLIGIANVSGASREERRKTSFASKQVRGGLPMSQYVDTACRNAAVIAERASGSKTTGNAFGSRMVAGLAISRITYHRSVMAHMWLYILPRSSRTSAASFIEDIGCLVPGLVRPRARPTPVSERQSSRCPAPRGPSFVV